MDELLNFIKERRSIKNFITDKEVPEELIEQVVEAGLYAANGRGLQAPEIIVVTNKALRNKIAKENSKIGGFGANIDPFYGAPVILIVIAPKNVSTSLYDGSLVLGNMMLMAHKLGLGSCWIHRAKEEFESDLGKEILQQLFLEDEYIGIGHLALGYANCQLPEAKPRKENRVHYIK